MAVNKRGSKWWVDFMFGHKRYRKPSPDGTRAGAIAYEILIRQRLARGEPLAAEEKKKTLLDEFSDQWMRDYVIVNNKHSEMLSKKMILRAHLIPFFGKTPLDEISTRGIEQFKALKIRTGLSNKSINNYLATLRKLLVTAQDWELLEKIPRIKPLRVMPTQMDYLTLEESERLVMYARGVWKDMILLALKTGLRFGELVALRWEDVNFQNNHLIVRHSIVGDIPVDSTKSFKIRYVPLLEEIRLTLIERKLKTKGKFVFYEKDGKYLMREYCRRNLLKICDRAGIRKIGWHALRHSFASHLAEKGITPNTIKELLGHSDIKTTMRYAHLGPLALKESIKVLEKRKSCHNIVTIGQNDNAKNETEEVKIDANDKTKTEPELC